MKKNIFIFILIFFKLFIIISLEDITIIINSSSEDFLNSVILSEDKIRIINEKWAVEYTQNINNSFHEKKYIPNNIDYKTYFLKILPITWKNKFSSEIKKDMQLIIINHYKEFQIKQENEIQSEKKADNKNQKKVEKKLISKADNTNDNKEVTNDEIIKKDKNNFSISDIIPLIIIFCIGILIIVYKIITFIKINKLKLKFKDENVFLCLRKRGFWLASKKRVVLADSKLNIVYNYIYEDLLNNKIDQKFTKKMELIENKNAKTKKLYDFVIKMVKGTEYPEFIDNIFNGSICQNMP